MRLFLLFLCVVKINLYGQLATEHSHPAFFQKKNLRLAKKQHIHQCASCQATKQRLARTWANRPMNTNHNLRSDTFDILNYNISVTEVNFNTNSIRAATKIQIKALQNNTPRIRFDLLKFTVDSVKQSGQNLTFTYNDTLLDIALANPLSTNQTDDVTVYYRGQPRQDSTWGGFYFQNGYAYNLGVGFTSNPHNFGRAWYPCFDNFVERATYDFVVTTPPSKRAHCNGVLVSETQNAGNTTRTWSLTTEIPSYLACVAVADYATVRQMYAGLQRQIPIELVALAGDTSSLKMAFSNLSAAMGAYEYWFGAYQWQKIGYSVVPFDAGAMEHATNIAYPRNMILNGLQYETLMAHELSHHWWGDWITCETAEDMWINEGMASYCEHLFLEYAYDRTRYINKVIENHQDVLTTAHQREGGYRAISGIPHEYTYGKHVYDKGASVAHNLRWYLGDSLFRVGLRAVLDSFALSDINSFEMRDLLTQRTGRDLTPFFEDWVFNGGFPHYEVDSVWYASLPNGNQKVEIRVSQKLVGAPSYHTNTPLQFSFYNGRQKIAEKTAYVSGSLTVVSFELPSIIPAEDILLNENHLLNQARYDFAGISRANGVANTGNTQIANFNITNIVDSAYLFVQYHPVAPTPDAGFSPYRLSDTRFWTIQGNWNPNFRATMRFDVNSTTDAALLAGGTDSILVLYRPTPNSNWSEHPNYTKRVVGGYVFFTINTVLKGDYAFANGDMGLGVDRNERTRLKSSRIFPNPTQNEVQIELNLRRKAQLNLMLIDKLGHILQTRKIELSSGKNLEQMQLGDLPAGMYFIKIQDMEGDSWDTHTIIKQ